MQQLIKHLLELKIWKAIAVGLTLASLGLSLTSDDPTKVPSIPHLDKAVHFFSYGLLFFAYWLGYFKDYSPKVHIYGACTIAAYSGLMELLQWQMDLGRTGDFWDFTANCFGIFFVYYGVRRLPMVFPPKYLTNEAQKKPQSRP